MPPLSDNGFGLPYGTPRPQNAPSTTPIPKTLSTGKGKLTIDPSGTYSASEKAAAQYMADLGHDVTLRPPTGTRVGGGTSDLLVDGIRYDVYTPKTSNPNRIIGGAAKKNDQAEGVVLDLSNTCVTQAQLGDVLKRIRGAGATNIKVVIIIGGD
ncbi:hypothetical protein SH668x_001797 [Planctomicrobium sp. SH668]|uniref:CdiA C-terminal domain-containing protein n=1 Tax=Planctomicrobium sp. SH668 TaxID=3448126 RepID=UPI003F5BF182